MSTINTIEYVSPNIKMAKVMIQGYYSFKSAKYYMGFTATSMNRAIRNKIIDEHILQRGSRVYKMYKIEQVQEYYKKVYKECCDITTFSLETGLTIGELLFLNRIKCLIKKMNLDGIFYYEKKLITTIKNDPSKYKLVDLKAELKDYFGYNNREIARAIFSAKRRKMFRFYRYGKIYYTTAYFMERIKSGRIKLPGVNITTDRKKIMTRFKITSFDFNRICKDHSIIKKPFLMRGRAKINAFDIDDFDKLKDVIKKKYTSNNPMLLFMRKNDKIPKNNYIIKYDDNFYSKTVLKLPVRMDMMFYPEISVYFKMKQNIIKTDDFDMVEVDVKNKPIRFFDKFSPDFLKIPLHLSKTNHILSMKNDDYWDFAQLFGGRIGINKNLGIIYSIDRKFATIKIKKFKDKNYNNCFLSKLNILTIDKIIRHYFRRKFKVLSLYEDTINGIFQLFIDNSVFIFNKVDDKGIFEFSEETLKNIISLTDNYTEKIKIEPDKLLENFDKNIITRKDGEPISKVKRLDSFLFKQDKDSFIKYAVNSPEISKFISLTHVLAIKKRCKYLTVNKEFDVDTLRGPKQTFFYTQSYHINILEIDENIHTLYLFESFFQNNRTTSALKMKEFWENKIKLELRYQKKIINENIA